MKSQRLRACVNIHVKQSDTHHGQISKYGTEKMKQDYRLILSCQAEQKENPNQHSKITQKHEVALEALSRLPAAAVCADTDNAPH